MLCSSNIRFRCTQENDLVDDALVVETILRWVWSEEVCNDVGFSKERERKKSKYNKMWVFGMLLDYLSLSVCVCCV